MKIKTQPATREDFIPELIEPKFLEFQSRESIVRISEDGITSEPWFSFKLNNLKDINFLVGANNSGKSRFLRGLMKLRSHNISVFEQKSYLETVDTIYNNPLFSEEFQHYRSRSEFNTIIDAVNKLVPQKSRLLGIGSINNEVIGKIDNCIEILSKFEEFLIGKTIYNPLRDLISNIKSLSYELRYCKNNRYECKIYIPVLRSLFNCEFLGESSYSEILKKYFHIENVIEQQTGLTLWKSIYNLQNSPKKRSLEKFQNFLSLNFFEKKSIELLADNDKKLLSVSIDKEDYRSINEIGDGIQQIIMIMFPIFLAPKNTWIFIEEPEMNLHPGYQRIFIETITKDKFLANKRLKYFITTHSNHFLDLTLRGDKTAIFQFEKLDNNLHTVKSNIIPSNEILDILGVQTSSVFLSNTSIWIEGPTDRKYISKLLRLFCDFNKKQVLKEDIDFAFFEYGGNLIDHYLFDDSIDFNQGDIREKINSFALSNRIFLLSDNDEANGNTTKGKKRQVLEDLSKEKENFLYKNTICREIENLLPKKIVKEFMFELVKGENNINKVEEIDFERSHYKNIGLGSFYEKLLMDNGIALKNLKSFRAPSGTLTNDYKIKLSNFVINSNYDYHDFIKENIELEEIIESLYYFIKR